MESSGQASFTLSSEVNAICHILLLALYIPLSAVSISGTGMDYLSDEDILSQSSASELAGFGGGVSVSMAPPLRSHTTLLSSGVWRGEAASERASLSSVHRAGLRASRLLGSFRVAA